MIGGAGYMAGKSGQKAASREDDEQQRLAALEAQAAPAAPAPPPPAPAQGDDLVSKIKELSQLKDAGALTESEFEAAKAKLLAS